MKLNNILLLAVIALALSSCGSTKHSYAYLKESNSRVLEPAVKDCTVMPMAVDLDVSTTRITHTVEYAWNPLMPLEKLKTNAITDTSLKYGCDVIVGAMTQSESFDMGRKIRILVTGYPATYKDFRKLTDQDVELLKKAATAPTSAEVSTESKSPLGIKLFNKNEK